MPTQPGPVTPHAADAQAPVTTADRAPHISSGLGPRESWAAVNDYCPLVKSLDVLSTRTAFLILREAFYGARRFDQFTERAEISEPVAAARLKELTHAGLLEKLPYREPGQRTRYEYRLTEKGADLWPTLLALFDWGSRWEFENGPRIGFAHAGCGGRVHTELMCEHGHRVNGTEEIEITRRRRSPGTASGQPGGPAPDEGGGEVSFSA